MTRDLNGLADRRHDVLIVGGGIHGSCAAWDAALRGLAVALVDKGDFGAATSANSLKVIHGGLRYLQSADLARMRESIRERSILLRIAPHLVQPLPFLVPTYGHGRHGREALAVALKITDLVGFDRNHRLPEGSRIPAGTILSRGECLSRFPGFERRGLTGGALWFDAQAEDTERLNLAFLISAWQRGAILANHVRVESLVRDGDGVRGARAVDLLTGSRLEIAARVVLDATGPWHGRILPSSGRPPAPVALAVNLVTRQVHDGLAVGFRSKIGPEGDPVVGGRRFLFLAPWRSSSLAGTSYRLFDGSPDEARAGERDLTALLDDFNAACPSLELAAGDVRFYHRGLLPLRGHEERGRPDALASDARVVDHEPRDGIRGLVSLVGVKYTTARRAARGAVDLVVAKLGRDGPASRTAEVPLYGAEDRDGGAAPAAGDPALPEDVRRRLARAHGGRAADVARALRAETGWAEPVAVGAEVLRGEVLHAVRGEMAVKLGDVVFGRTGMGAEGCPPREHLEAVAGLMAAELGWSAGRREAEISEVLEAYAPLPIPGSPGRVRA